MGDKNPKKGKKPKKGMKPNVTSVETQEPELIPYKKKMGSISEKGKSCQ